MNWVQYGPNAWLLRFADEVGEEAFARGQAVLDALARHPPRGLAEVVPAFTTVLLEFESSSNIAADVMLPALTKRIETALAGEALDAPVIEVPVIYDGPDLDRLARLRGLSTDEVRRLHSEPIYRVYMIGFSPGFPYLGELDARLHTPRLASPRTRVPAGSVAIGGEHTGIYSADSPGGWNIIGRTPLKLIDRARGDDGAMFLLRRGDRVKFQPVRHE